MNALNAVRNQANLSSTVYVRCKNKLYYVDDANYQCFEIRLNSEALQTFDEKLKPNSDPKTLSKKQLKTITRLTGHVHREEMAEMIMRYLRRLPNGQAEIEKQIREQFPEGWKEIERARRKRDLEALVKVTEAIEQSQEHDNCDAAIEEFSQHLENEYKSKEATKTGYHFNDKLFELAIRIFSKNFFDFGGDNSHKNNLYWRKVIGKILRYVPTCLAQAIIQHPSTLLEKGEKLRRSLQVHCYGNEYYEEDTLFYPLDKDPKFIMGRDFAVLGGRCDHYFRVPSNKRHKMHEFFQQRDESLKSIRHLTRPTKNPILHHFKR